MKTKVITAFLAVFMLAMTACGTISPPIQTVETTTIPITAESLDSAVSSEVESTVNNEQVKSDTFIAEFFDSNISFEDTSELVTVVLSISLDTFYSNKNYATRKI